MGEILANGQVIAQEGEKNSEKITVLIGERQFQVQVTEHDINGKARVFVGQMNLGSSQLVEPNGRPKKFNGLTIVHEKS